jgi:hypothetical protein
MESSHTGNQRRDEGKRCLTAMRGISSSFVDGGSRSVRHVLQSLAGMLQRAAALQM